MQNKQVLISNLEVLTKELMKVEQQIGQEYAKTLASTRDKGITKEEIYLENVLMIAMEAIENVQFLTFILKDKTPQDLVKTAEEDGLDYKEISKDMKSQIVQNKMDENPLLGLLATFEALMRMTKDKK